MLTVKGIINLSGGSMGDTTFMKIDGKHHARNKLEVSKDRFKKAPNFARVRENANQFGTASSSGKALRNSINSILHLSSDTGVAKRLHKEISKVFKTDGTNPRGEASIKESDISLLIGFNFNIKASLQSIVNLRYTTELNRTSGMLIINIPTFKPVKAIKAPEGTTHFKLITSGVAIDFKNLHLGAKSEIIESPLMVYDENDNSATTAVHHLQIDPQDSLFLVMGIQFYKVAGRWVDMVKNGAANCLAVVDAG